jgi:predicted RNase H-like HicB family nuclease
MDSELTMIYWKGDHFWLGKFKERPDIMTQGRTIEELEENLRDAYHLMVMDDVPEEYQEKHIAV